LGGLLAQAIASPSPTHTIIDSVLAGAWWHSQAGILAMQERTLLGVDALTLSQYLLPALRQTLRQTLRQQKAVSTVSTSRPPTFQK
jgi:NAD(P)H-hydrate epimerase